MAIVVDSIVYPTTRQAALTFRVYEDTDAALSGLTVLLASAGTTATESVYASGSFADAFSDSTLTGAGTIASPYLFSVQQDGGWPPTTVNVAVLKVTASAAAAEDDYLLDYTQFTHVRATPAWEPIGDGYLKLYEPAAIRPHATVPHVYRFESTMQQICLENVRGLMNRAFDEAGFNTLWTNTNCTAEWFSSIGGRNTAIYERDPVGDQAVICSATASATASLERAMGSVGATGTVTCSVYVKLPAGVSAPANGCRLEYTTNSGTTVYTKNFTPTTDWVQHFVQGTPAGTTNSLKISMPNATAGDQVMWALPNGTFSTRTYTGINVGWPVIRMGSNTGPLSDGDDLVIPSASVPSQMLGSGGAFAFKWIPIFDSVGSGDVTFFCCGELTHEILWAPSRDNAIRIRSGTVFPVVRSNELVFSAGDVITVEVSPTTGRIRISGCSGSGNGLGDATWGGIDAGTAAPYTWPAAEMLVGDRQPDGQYSRGSHMGAGYIGEPYVVPVF